MVLPVIAGAMAKMATSGNKTPMSESEMKMISFALILLFLVPILFNMFAPAHMNAIDTDSQWKEEISMLEDRYYAQTGTTSTPEVNVWTLTGIYTPFMGEQYGYTPDGWVFGSKVTQNTVQQYGPTSIYSGELVVAQAENGLWYYLKVPDSMTGIVTAKYTTDPQTNAYTITDTNGATIYSAVTFDRAHKSDIFFTTSTRGEMSGHYYYAFTGYRYVFQPLSSFYTTVDGDTKEIDPITSSLSLIWYEYTEMTAGIAGQLAINGGDRGVTYLIAEDIIREFNSNNYTSTFDMTFNQVKMHLSIRLDPSRLANGMSIRDCYNLGYWSVLVYSDAILESTQSPTFEFSAENVLGTLISLFTFNITEEYDVDGWIGILASLLITLPFYAMMLIFALRYNILFILMGLLAVAQAFVKLGTGWWPFG